MNEGGSGAELRVGKRVQAARQKAGLTQQALCHKAGLSYSTLAKIERGAIKSPSIFTIQAIASAVGTTIDDLVGQAMAVNPGKQTSKSKSGISFVYFDVNGCMVRFYHRAFSKMAEEYQVSVDQIESVFWHYNDEVCRGEMSIHDFNLKLAERLHTEMVYWPDYYTSACEATPGVGELVKELSQHYGVGLLTNIMPGLVDALTAAKKLPDVHFDSVVDSSAIKIIKPDAKIFEEAANRAGVPASEILLVDDTRANLVAAEKEGWHVLWFDYARPEESIASVKAAMELATS